MSKTRDEVREEALGALRIHKRAGAGISMGVGKTRLGLEHFQLVINKYNKVHDQDANALIVAPTKVIIQGWKDEAIKWNMEHLLENISFSTYRSLTKQVIEDFDVVYLDECHSLKLSHDVWLRKFDGYIIGLTGTPPDPKYKSEKLRMVEKYCPIKYKYLIDEAISDSILNDYKITVHMLPLDREKTHLVKTKNKSWYTSEYEHYNYWTQRVGQSFGPSRMKMSVMRMKAMQVYKTKDEYGKKLLDQAGEKCILFANEQKQADALCVNSYHSNNKDSEVNMEKFEQGKITKLSCVLQLSEGANVSGLKKIIILHAYGNNKKSAQRIGRGLRLNPNDTCEIDILCFKDSVDEKWVTGALEGFDQSKISWYDTTII
jgi:superfamily II DNA or RNA helicase